ncbi:condensation domain-containing protein [Micromonospora sp. CP22]|uniref:condensation domain-containing protein n=1 Tax=Micromonospora sp. CP22 TaxID=2580517 RepID=UPI0018AD2533|nr:condensation domain-containing protein [Micromonospora sp. CP22]
MTPILAPGPDSVTAPASVSQRLLWMIQHYRSDFGALSCPLLCRISGPVDLDRLRAALDEVARRHASLRTTFQGRGARLSQVIHPPRPMPFEVRDLSATADPSRTLAQETVEELARPVPVDQWPTRATVWRLATDHHALCLNLHHLVTDAYSTGVLLADLATCYGDPGAPTGDSWSYAHFAQWQHDRLRGPELDRQRSYWRDRLAGGQLPSLGRPTGARPGGPAVAEAGFPAGVLPAVRELAARIGTTPFVVLLAAFYTNLHRHTGQTDVCVASMYANRSRPEVRETVGLIANMVLLRTLVDPAASFLDLVRAAHRTAVGALVNQDLPVQMLPAGAAPTGPGRPDDVVFNVMADLARAATVRDVTFELELPVQLGSRFPLEQTVVPIGAEPRAVLFRADDRMTDDTAAEFLAGYVRIVGDGAVDPSRRVVDLAGRSAGHVV